MSDTAVIYSGRRLANSRRILDVLLRSLIQKKTVTPDDIHTVLGATIRRVAETVYAQAITIFMLDQATNRIRFQNVYYAPTLYGIDSERKQIFDDKARELEKITLAPGHGIVGQVISTGKSSHTADVSREKGHNAKIDESTGFVTRSMITVPLLVGEKAVGAIQVLNKCEDGESVTAFTREDVMLLEDVASYSAKIIQRALDPDTPLSDTDMANYIAKLAKCEFVDLDENFEPNIVLLKNIGEEALKRYQVMPLGEISPKELRAAVANPLDFQTIQDFELVTSLKLREKVVAASSQIEEALLRVFPEGTPASDMAETMLLELEMDDTAEIAVDDEDDENSAPIVRLANSLVEEAYVQGASDIHIEPYENKVMVRYRIDGVCRQKHSLPRQAARPLIARLKIMSDLDIAERRLPQDGRIVFKKFNNKYDLDLRVSMAPMNHGEKVCMRILDKTKSTLPLHKLGFSEYNLGIYRDIIKTPYGMILHCGPTGSGKSMTLYAALNEINSPDVNIQTAEDPIEYTLPGLNQLQVHKQIGLTFAAALRSFLRQDPDIILVGEIRDRETADIAVEAALTGHLLFSTLHTNDAPSTITRFTEIGIEPFMISTSLVCVCAQRLMRRSCACATEDDPNDEERRLLERSQADTPIGKVKRPVGCAKCNKTGYKGRTGIHELLTVNDEMREQISTGATAEKIKVAARKGGMRTLFEDCMEKVKAGVTDLTEALGTTRPDDEPSN